MSVILVDLCPITESEFKELKKLVGEKLKEVKIKNGWAFDKFVDGDLELVFEKHTVTVSMQESDEYGTNVFWEIKKRRKRVKK